MIDDSDSDKMEFTNNGMLMQLFLFVFNIYNTFKYRIQISCLMRRIEVLAAIGGGSIALALVFMLFVFSRATRDYAIDVDPIKDSQNLFSTSRVTVTNIGKLPLTNILVSYGGNGNKSSEKLAS